MKRERRSQIRRLRRAARARARIRGTAERPRLSVFRSNRHIAAQLIDDGAQRTIVSASDREFPKATKRGAKKPVRRERALWVGRAVAERAQEKKIQEAVFDRGRYRYHGVVAALAQGARAAGLKF
ncbi:MAG: 50S ribosomal protein L18 [Candidatus Sungbacteria bacterium RIFCSPLOWO2_01_FULL_60_25]|uniref:Large ribosomal subunit protein uL18 n=1 Tax=Candidatus Sungbacteria bacterium RIFCSPLOWO2_01_FULL_60_25 TaxID=1802281 RepID=A0A1G2LD61_9BACT|nr:MAG: 50S ribosomal protein L18 [Candidatus Sungbacteria bacterium RIFCSPLOWO2_01_FULL_60_25]